MIEKMIGLIDKRKKLDINDDYGYSEVRRKEMELLKIDLNESITLLNSLDSEHYYYINENFEDLSSFYKSNELIECMKRNALRTGTNCTVDIEYAIKALSN